MSLADYEVKLSLCLNRTTIAFGGTGTGKSTIMRDIMHKLGKIVCYTVVFCSTGETNTAYKELPKPLLYTELIPERLENIWECQQARIQKYKMARAFRTLYVECMPSSARDEFKNAQVEISRAYGSLIEMANNAVSNEDREMMREDANMVREYMEDAIFKKLISKNMEQIKKNLVQSSDPDAEDAIKVLPCTMMRPHMAIIIDDMTEQLEMHKKNPIFNKIFTQGRHNYISLIICMHDDSKIQPMTKKNAGVLIFTDKQSINTYVNRASNGVPTSDRKRMLGLIDNIFTPLDPDSRWRKAVYVPGLSRLFQYTAKEHKEIPFCTPLVQKTLDEVAGVRVEKNKYSRIFE